MTKSFFEAGDSTFTVSDSNTKIFGASGTQTVRIKAGAANILVDSNVEKISFDNPIGAYKFQQAGNQLRIFDAVDTLITQLTTRDTGTDLTFSNGTVRAIIFRDATGVHVSIGGVVVNDQIATTISTGTMDGVIALGSSFSLTSNIAGAPTQEGNTIVFTVTPSTIVDKATSLSLGIVGQVLNSITSITNADDFGAVSPITFNVGDTTAKQISVTVKNDGVAEGLEAYNARLLDENGNEKSSVIGAIFDGVPNVPSLSISTNNNSVNEGNSVIFTVTSDAIAPTGGMTIPYNFNGSSATNGVDFSVIPATGVITIPAGEKTSSLTFNTNTDLLSEPPETIVVTLGAVSGMTILNDTATTTINDTSVVLEANKFFFLGSTSVNEGGKAVYTISHAPVTTAVTIPYTITGSINGSDYSVTNPSPITFNINDTSKTLEFPMLADSFTEGNETFTIALGNPVIALSGGVPSLDTIATGQSVITTTVLDTSVTANSTFKLTTSNDSITGTNGDDLIFAYVDASGTTDTFTAVDSINGGAGNDTLLMTVDGADVGFFPAATITGVEIISVHETGGVAGNYNLSTISGLTTVINNLSSDDVTFNVAAGTKMVIKGDGVNSNANTTFNNSTDLTFNGGVNGGNVTRNATGVSTITINSIGTENVIDTLDLDTGRTLSSLTINALSNLTATLANDYAAGASVYVTGSASKVDLSGSALSSNITNINAASLSGGAMVQVNQADKLPETQFLGGNGSDTLDIGKVKYNTSLTVDGALGFDTLKISDQDTLSPTTINNISNFERLEIYDDNDGNLDTFDASLLRGISTIQIDTDSLGDGYILNNMSASQALNVIIAGNQTVAPKFNLSNATFIGNIDTLGLTIDAGVSGNAVTVAGINAPGVERINLNAIDSFTATTLTGLTALTTITVSGDGDVNLTTGILQLNLNSTIDATTSTGMITVDASAATTTPSIITGMSIKGSLTQANFLTGSAQPDILTGGAGADSLTGAAGADTLNGGGNSDILNGGADNDVINGGAGADFINGGAGSDTLNGESGDDVFIYAATADLFDTLTHTLNDSIVGGSGTNSLSVGTSGTAFAIAATDIWTRANGIDSLVGVPNSTANTLVLDKSAETAGVKLIDLSSNTALTGNIISVGSFTATNTTLIGSAIGTTSMVGGAGNDTITGGAGSDTISGGTGSDVINVTAGTDSIMDFATVDILNVSAGATAKIIIPATGGTVNVSAVNNAGTLFVDGSAGAATSPETITGSASADIITGGAGSDIITGGAGVDTITGGAGADKFIIATFDTDSAAASAIITDIIADFKTASDTISLGALGVNHIDAVTAVTAAPAVNESASVAFAPFSSAAVGSIVVAGLTITSDGTSAFTAANIASVITGGTVAGLTKVGTLAGYTAVASATAGTVVFTSTTLATNVTPDLTVSVTGVAVAPAITITQGAAAVTAVIGVAESGNFVKALAAVADLPTLLTAADNALAGLTKYYVGQVTAGDTYLVTDSDATGITNVIKLTGVALTGIAAGDIVV